MQLNIYVPKEKRHVLEALERMAQVTGRPKSGLVLEAIERYAQLAKPELGRFRLGSKPFSRADLYRARSLP